MAFDIDKSILILTAAHELSFKGRQEKLCATRKELFNRYGTK